MPPLRNDLKNVPLQLLVRPNTLALVGRPGLPRAVVPVVTWARNGIWECRHLELPLVLGP